MAAFVHGRVVSTPTTISAWRSINCLVILLLTIYAGFRESVRRPRAFYLRAFTIC
jgi:hypothetical protein